MNFKSCGCSQKKVYYSMNKNYIIKTDYFNKPSRWIARCLRFAVAILVLYLVDLYKLEAGSNILTGAYIFIGMLAISFVFWPIDELALDKDNLYFIRRSVLPILNSTAIYKVSDFKGIGTYNISKQVGIFTLLVPVFNLYRVEIIFKDNSSKSQDLTIDKKALKEIILKVKESIT